MIATRTMASVLALCTAALAPVLSFAQDFSFDEEALFGSEENLVDSSASSSSAEDRKSVV